MVREKTFMYGQPYITVRLFLAKCLINRDRIVFDFDGIIGNNKTREFIKYVGKEKAYMILEQIGKKLKENKVNLEPLYAKNNDTWKKDCVSVRTRLYPNLFEGNDYFFKTSWINGKWYVVLHD